MKPSISTTLASLAAWTGLAQAQFEDFFNITLYPNEQTENVTRFLQEARTTAGTDLSAHFGQRCTLSQIYSTLADASASSGFVAPREVFDDFYFVGQSDVSAWAYDTGDGLVVFDALNNAAEAETILVGGLEALGFSGADIKHLVITHEHFDHYGGARYLQDTYGPAVYASAPAWDALATARDDVPVRDRVIADGDELAVGDVKFRFFVTPGHTPGTVSTIMPLSDNGVAHTAGFFGGVGTPSSAADKDTIIRSFGRFTELVREAGADTLIANHQTQDRTLYHLDVLEHRADGGVHPYVIGEDALQRYFTMVAQCVRVNAARVGQNLQTP